MTEYWFVDEINKKTTVVKKLISKFDITNNDLDFNNINLLEKH